MIARIHILSNCHSARSAFSPFTEISQSPDLHVKTDQYAIVLFCVGFGLYSGASVCASHSTLGVSVAMISPFLGCLLGASADDTVSCAVSLAGMLSWCNAWVQGILHLCLNHLGVAYVNILNAPV